MSSIIFYQSLRTLSLITCVYVRVYVYEKEKRIALNHNKHFLFSFSYLYLGSQRLPTELVRPSPALRAVKESRAAEASLVFPGHKCRECTDSKTSRQYEILTRRTF